MDGATQVAQTLIARAERDAGHAIGDAGLRARFIGLVESFEQQALTLSAPRTTAAHNQFVDVLTKRLMLEGDRVRFPEVVTQRIERPIFVVGFPRTGTTLLHCLLMTDPGCAAPLLWETRNPSPPPGLVANDVAERRERGDADASAFCNRIPGLLTAHPYFDMGADTPIEDEEIAGLDFQSGYPTWYPDVPMLLAGVGATDPTAGYRFHKKFLQHLQAGRSVSHWVCKGTAHQFTLSELWAVYPDALCIWAHRRPAETYGSTLELAAICNEGICGEVDRPALADAMLGALRAGLDAVLSAPEIDDPRLVHVRYEDLVADPVALIRVVHTQAQRPYSDEFEERMRRWLADPANASNRHGKFRYDLGAFGLSDTAVDTRFADYSDRFLHAPTEMSR